MSLVALFRRKTMNIRSSRFDFAFLFILIASAFSDVNAQSDLSKAIEDYGGGHTVIMGTWTWDIESNSQGGGRKSDVWWEQVDDTRQYLVPINGAGIALIKTDDYESVGAKELTSAKFSRCPVENVDLIPGTVVVVRTAEGNFAKIRIVGYRELHDVSFVDAQYAPSGWLSYLLTRPNRQNYHLEVDWTLFSRPSAAPAAAN